MKNEGLLIIPVNIDSEICSTAFIVPVAATPEDYNSFAEILNSLGNVPMLNTNLLREILRACNQDENEYIYKTPIYITPISVYDYECASGENQLQKVTNAAVFSIMDYLSSNENEPIVSNEEFCAILISGIKGEKVEVIPKTNFYFINPILRLVNEKMNMPEYDLNISVLVGIGELPIIVPIEALIAEDNQINETGNDDNEYIAHPLSIEETIQEGQKAVEEYNKEQSNDDRIVYYGACVALQFNLSYGVTPEMIRRYIDVLDSIETLPISASAKSRIQNIMPRPCYVLDNLVKHSELKQAVEASKSIMGITPEMTYTDFEKMLGGIL